MNDNEIKKEATGSNPAQKSAQTEKPTPKENVTVYNDMDIFDFDAHRKAKAEREQQSKPKPASPAPTSAQNSAPAGTKRTPTSPSSPIKTAVGVVGAQKAATQANQIKSPNGAQQPKTAPKVTNVTGQKTVFGASSGTRRKPESVKQPKVKPIKPVGEKTRGANPLTLLAKSLIYIGAVLLISCTLAYFIIVVANDVFAFVKSDVSIQVEIPEHATLDEIAEELHEKKVISYPDIFVLYTNIRGNDPGRYVPGIYTVSPSQNYDELLRTFIKVNSTGLTEVRVTIPEGYTVDDIINLLVEEKGIGTREGFIDAIQHGEYDYWFIDSLTDLDPDRKYRLEGYLYPDTYYFYKESEETVIIDKMLANFYAKFSIQYKQECEKAGMSIDDVINLASIIQMEAKYSVDYPIVSSVIHNRLNSAYYNHRLDCDSTIQYILEERKEDLSHEDTLIDDPYNSYQNSGLPPGPISNPTLKAIRAALYPEQTTQAYYFFVSDIDGKMLYGRNYDEHLANIAKVDANAAAAKKDGTVVG